MESDGEMEIDICSSTPWNLSGWQKGMSFKRNFNNALFPNSNPTEADNLDASATLTTDAVCIIIVVLVFIVLAVMGTSITAYEIFCEKSRKAERRRKHVKERKAKNEEENVTVSNNLEEQLRKVGLKDLFNSMAHFRVSEKKFSRDSHKEQFNCIHRFRFFGSICLIFALTCLFYIFTKIFPENMEAVKSWISWWISQFMPNSFFILDRFIAMRIVALVFVVLVTVRSSINAFEFFCEKKKREEKRRKYVKEKDEKEEENKKISNGLEKQTRKAWLNDIKSFLTCFCVVENGKKIFNMNSSKEQFDCIHGIRFFSCIWIILAHTGLFYPLTIKKVETVKPWTSLWITQLFLNSIFLVDGFFVISGFLNGYSFSKDYTKNNGKISISYFYIKRYIRLTPVYMIVSGIFTLFLSSSCGGAYNSCSQLHSACKEYWWWHLLYINNFQSYAKQCIIWGWSLALEIQFYIVSPIFLILLLRRPNLGYSFTSLCIVLSCFARIAITKHCNLVDGITRMSSHIEELGHFFYRASIYFDKFYQLPHTRINSYLVGILLGYYTYKRRMNGKDMNISKVALYSGWIGSIVLIMVSFFVMYNRKEDVIEIAIYNGVNSLLYAAGFAWILYVCVNGQGGRLNSILSCKALFPFSRISYCSYLIHLILVLRFYHASPDVEEYSVLSVMCHFLFVYVWTLIFSLIASLLFELPTGNLLDFIRKRSRTQKNQKGIDCN
ncbi:Nose resistant to fluoxetine protein 6 like protein [Argiope bruennichi]|uniref:Nose resistant to fluoxetine protein 6 like protein n=1 Tax=Argiope bruennichi TaxID=94029 RepID=A0A8T0G173_ARGBR|nr:Nose resistant to fluoxetine protein 6 like protein [Argiope bruennichi]